MVGRCSSPANTCRCCDRSASPHGGQSTAHVGAVTEPDRCVSSVLEMDEQPAGVLTVLLHPVVPGLDVLAVQEPQHPLLELTTALTRYDLHRLGAGAFCLVDDLQQGAVDIPALVEDVVQVELEPHCSSCRRRASPVYQDVIAALVPRWAPVRRSRSADAAWSVLHADPRADRTCALRNRVLPRALAGTTHHQQVPIAQQEPDRLATPTWTEQQPPR